MVLVYMLTWLGLILMGSMAHHIYSSTVRISHGRWLRLTHQNAKKRDDHLTWHDRSQGARSKAETAANGMARFALKSPGCANLLIDWSHTVIPQIIQFDHFAIETHGDLGIVHFKKPPCSVCMCMRVNDCKCTFRQTLCMKLHLYDISESSQWWYGKFHLNWGLTDQVIHGSLKRSFLVLGFQDVLGVSHYPLQYSDHHRSSTHCIYLYIQ